MLVFSAISGSRESTSYAHLDTNERRLWQTTRSQIEEYPIFTGVSAQRQLFHTSFHDEHSPAALNSSGKRLIRPDTLEVTKAW